ncbi:hypothetical protein GCM10009800_05270 [Nocardiopsis rhodophaea]
MHRLGPARTDDSEAPATRSRLGGRIWRLLAGEPHRDPAVYPSHDDAITRSRNRIASTEKKPKQP